MVNLINIKVKRTIKSHEARKVIKNISWLFLDKILKLSIGVLLVISLTRYLGPERFGLLNYVTSLVVLFTAIGALGLNAIVVRDLIEKPNSNETLGTSFVLKLTGGIMALFLLALTVIILRPNDELSKYLAVLLGFRILFKSSDIIKFWYESKIESKNTVLTENAVYVFMAAVKLILIYLNAPLASFVLVLLLESVFIFVFLFLLYLKGGGKIINWKFTSTRSKELLNDSWPIIVSSTAWIFYSKIDQVMIGQILGNKEVGYYAAANKLSEISTFIPTIIAFSIIPSILKYRSSNRTLYDKYFQMIYNIVTSILILLAIVVSLFPVIVIETLYGTQYTPAATVLSIQFWIVVFIGLAKISGRYLVNDNRQKITMVRHLAGVLINLPLNYFLINIYGIEGAAWASLISLVSTNYLFDSLFKGTRNIFMQKTRALFFIWIFSFLIENDKK